MNDGTASDSDAGAGRTDGGTRSAQDGGSKASDSGIVGRDASFSADDPPARICGPDGGERPGPEPGGAAECPADKNLEGCPCPTVGESAACWPGKRVNRERGLCRDGTARCVATDAGSRWSACEGYVLPSDASVGSAACKCFSTGRWRLSNLAPCVYSAPSGNVYVYSSVPIEPGRFDCGSGVTEPPAVPSASWSDSTLRVDCSGQFRLCYTIKAGHVAAPNPDDCTLMQHCEDVWYEQAGADQMLQPLPGWVASDLECSRRFEQVGGYGEMSVRGTSIDCEPIDDGAGEPYVFYRTAYCPPTCVSSPDAPGCEFCGVSGSGMFGP
ncbi:MAG: hypothetical protein EHM50_08370 [Lysobacterales bacterium]|nr:MAG: hypothetical protein EHM50_08370 [Xanthomonadales bacterium]